MIQVVPIRFDTLKFGEETVDADGALGFAYNENWFATKGAFPLSLTLPFETTIQRSRPAILVSTAPTRWPSSMTSVGTLQERFRSESLPNARLEPTLCLPNSMESMTQRSPLSAISRALQNVPFLLVRKGFAAL